MKNKFLTLLVLLPLGLLMLLISAAVAYPTFYYNKHKDDWKAKTTPLNQRKIEILCANFELDKEHTLCNGKKDVYGPDFITIIRDTFRPYEYETPSSEAATYYEVEEKIGIFRVEECEDIVTTGDGFTYFICHYDLRGDEEFPIGIIFTYPEMATFRIMMSLGLDGE